MPQNLPTKLMLSVEVHEKTNENAPKCFKQVQCSVISSVTKD